jgi:hypothetical protein
MDENWKAITDFVEKYNNTLVIDGDKVYVLRGCIDIPLDDYFWSLQDIKGEYLQSSCVGRLTPLKGFIPTEDYDAIAYYFNINLQRIAEIISQKVQ